MLNILKGEQLIHRKSFGLEINLRLVVGHGLRFMADDVASQGRSSSRIPQFIGQSVVERVNLESYIFTPFNYNSVNKTRLLAWS